MHADNGGFCNGGTCKAARWHSPYGRWRVEESSRLNVFYGWDTTSMQSGITTPHPPVNSTTSGHVACTSYKHLPLSVCIRGAVQGRRNFSPAFMNTIPPAVLNLVHTVRDT